MQARYLVAALTTSILLAGCAGQQQKNSQAAAASEDNGPKFVVGAQYDQVTNQTLDALTTNYSTGSIASSLGDINDQDRQALALATQKVLLQGKTTSWKTRRNKTSVSIAPQSAEANLVPATLRFLPEVTPVDSLTLLNIPYWVKSTSGVNIRTAPSTDASVAATLLLGTTFTALGKTDTDWIAVGRNGVLVGYMYSPLVAPTPYSQSASATDLDTFSGTLANKDVTFFNFSADVVREKSIGVRTQCQTLALDIRSKSVKTTEQSRLCQDFNGTWANR